MLLIQVEQGAGEEVKEDYRVTVIDTSTGKKLAGDQAPLKSELEQWLKEHPKSVDTLSHYTSTLHQWLQFNGAAQFVVLECWHC